MSLRREIHTAFDAVSPPMGGMAERIVETARRESRTYERRDRFMFRMRVPIALVAALALVAVVAAIFVGITLRNSLAPTPAPGGAPDQTTQYDAVVAQLEARPVNLPTAFSGAGCPSSPGNNRGFDFGSGPVFANGSNGVPTAWGNYWDISYFVDPKVAGPVLIRGRDLITGESVIFNGMHAFGPGATTPGVPRGWHTEAVLDASKPDHRGTIASLFTVRQSLSKSFIGCVGFQIDGASFSETITAWSPG